MPAGSPSTIVSMLRALGLGLVERGQRGAARIADQQHALAAELLAHEFHARAQILDHPLHQKHRIVAGVT